MSRIVAAPLPSAFIDHRSASSIEAILMDPASKSQFLVALHVGQNALIHPVWVHQECIDAFRTALAIPIAEERNLFPIGENTGSRSWV
ncbi:MAG: hypothetical protein IPP63_08350 [Chloracidobacterium sp.]|nr:hypothetical protein [Chloracidobacterium sp.]